MKFEESMFVRCECGNLLLPKNRKVRCPRCGKKGDIYQILERWLKDEQVRYEKMVKEGD
jgi:hypothetical protein